MKKIILALFATVAISCSATLDCLTESAPEWERKTLSEGMRFETYNETVELYSDGPITIQEFDVQGDLPNGLMSNFDGDTFRVSGTPTELGNFQIKLIVRVAGEDPDGNTNCERAISRSYRIRIN